ncbi:putative glycoside hydrolase [Thermus sp.]|uniref:putative glycoside hydrolase n=1 Tax=Thermus sp. TaxID=275 RepID=UPI00298F332C|nr:putative glycoside hydrolase [Thermus sp.]MDW8358832.1 putative glycoside hydrolase [Thermus sp.]
MALSLLPFLLPSCQGPGEGRTLSLQGASLGEGDLWPGGSAALTLILSSPTGYEGFLVFSLFQEGRRVPWAGLAPAQRQVQVPRGGQVSVTLTLGLSPQAPPGRHTLQVLVTYEGQVARGDLSLTVRAPDFSLQPEREGLDLAPGTGGEVRVRLVRQGPVGPVALGLEGSPLLSPSPTPEGISWRFAPNPVPGNEATLSLEVGERVPPGEYPLTLRGQAGELVRTRALTLSVQRRGGGDGGNPADFRLEVQPGSLSLQQGEEGRVEVRVQRQGPVGPVALGLEGSPLLSSSPAPDRIAWSISPNPAEGDGGTLTLRVGAQVPPGRYPLTLRGRAQGVGERQVGLILEVRVPEAPGFRLLLDPGRLEVTQGEEGPTVLTIRPQGGFRGAVALSLVTGEGAPAEGFGLSPGEVRVEGEVRQTLRVRVSNAVPEGSYPLRLRGASGGLVQEVPLEVAVRRWQDQGPFVRTALVLYGGLGQTHPEGCYPVAEAARFHLLETSAGSHAWGNWCEVRNRQTNDAYAAIKRLNPRVKILLYYMGPGQVIVSYWDRLSQEEWEWLKRNHGRGSPDRWIALGVNTGEYLRSLYYPVERAMHLGNPNWQAYWLRTRYERAWVHRAGGHDGTHADGIFLDGMQYGVSWADAWRRESCYREYGDRPGGEWVCQEADHPDFYYDPSTGRYRQDLWRQHYGEFLRRAVPYFRGRGLDLGLNAWRIVHPDQIALYEELGPLVMEECGFLCWGVPRVGEWEEKLRVMAEARNYRILSVNAAPGSGRPPQGQDPRGHGLQRMDQNLGGRTGWQWLWFALGSYWLAYNPERTEAYFTFTLWEYGDQYWFEEYDPALLHLGRPLGPAQRAEPGLWWRPFERGWVAVNANPQGKTLRVPGGGRARLLSHGNFRNPLQAPLVDLERGVALEPYHGAVFLRE